MNGKSNSLRFTIRDSKKNYSAKSNLTAMPAAVIALTGIALIITEWFPSVGISWWVTLCAMVVVLVILLCTVTNNAVKKLAVAVPVSAIVITAIFNKVMLKGFGCLANDFFNTLTTVTGRMYMDFAIADSKYVLMALALITVICVSFICCSIITGKTIFILPIAIPIYLGVIAGIYSVNISSAIFFIGIIMIAICKGNLSAREAFGGVPTYILIIILCTAVAVTVGLMYENKLDTDFAESIGKKIHSIKYDSNTNAMPEGDLENLPELNKNSTPALQLTMEQPQKMYLKGRIYEVYDGTSWKKADTKETAQYEDLFYWLHKEGFYGQSQIAYASMFVSGQQAAEMTISNLSACNEFGYVPYAMYGNESLPSDMIGDNHSYSTQHIQYLAGSVPEWYKVQQNLASAQNRGNIGQYLRNEAAYEAYVKSVDLQLTNESWSVINRQLGEDTTAKTLSQIRDIINDYLSGALVYDETVKTYNGGSDFVQYTLEYSGKGYDVHYATIATLMLRYYGVPARYVEGYFLSADEAERYAAGEKIILTEEHAHAWTEYYLSGVGFIPFEVTPGYIDDEELELGAMDSENMQIYTGEHMKYASVQPPENIEEPQQSRFSFSMKPIYFVYMAGLLLAVLTALVLIRRKNFKKVMETMDAADNRHNIAMNYGYAQKLIKHCNIELPQNSIDMERLNKEAIFSNHTLDDIQRQKMKEYVQDVLDACKKKWSVVQKIRYKLWDCLY